MQLHFQICLINNSFSVLGGSLGLICSSAVTVVAGHFERWRGLAFGLVTAGAGIGTFVYPYLIDLLLMTYGWRGSLLLIGGITLNACVCGALMRPNRIRSTQNFEQQQDVQKIETTESFLKLFKSPRYIILCSSNFLFSFGYSVFSTHMPAFSVRALGLNEYEMSTLVSVTGISNLFFRLLQGAILDVRCVTRRLFMWPATQAWASSLAVYHLSFPFLAWWSRVSCLEQRSLVSAPRFLPWRCFTVVIDCSCPGMDFCI